ncbi:MAG: GumC family protein [Janthinobacterium lividum]
MQDHLARTGRERERALRPAEGRFDDDFRLSPSFEDPHDHDDHERPGMVSEYYRICMRHRWLIAGLACLGLVLSLLFHLTTQPVYETRTSLEIQSMNSEFMDNRSVTPTAALPSDAVVQTQMKLLGSESLADRVKLQLSATDHASQVEPGDMLSKIQRQLHLPSGQKISFDKLLDETADGVKIKPMGISQLVEVTCDSWDPNFAADYCNTLTTEFQTADMESRGSQAKHISDWLVRQAADVRQKAEESQRRLEAATGGNGLMLSPQTDSIGEERLKQMQTELVRAEADRMEKQAELAEVQSGGVDGSPDTSAYSASKLRLAELQAQVAALVPPLTEANPKVIKLRSQITEVQQNMQREKAIGTSKLQEAYQAAKHREDLLSLSYQKIQGSVSSDLQKSSEIDLLRRDVQAEQQLYQTLLQRAKEAGFASAMPASTIRVVDKAKPPTFAVYPRRLVTAGVFALIGVVIGIVTAFLLERQIPRLRLPGDVSRFVRIEELGVIPATAAQSSRTSVGTKLISPVQNAMVKFNGKATDTQAERTEETWSEDALVAESYRSTTLSLLLARPDKHSRTFVVSSPNAGEGKTTVTTNLGIALSKSKLRVVLVDGDMRKPRLHDVLSVDNSRGLRDLLRDGVSAYEGKMDLVCKPTAYENLSVIPAGSGKGSISDLLHSPELRILLDDLAERFDVVLVDSPPMLHIADARILAAQTSQVILVFRSGVTKRSNAVTARRMLERDRVEITGSILNDFDPSREGQRKYYNGYYDYYGAGKDDLGAKAS